ncbi:hypothetical protein cypCar_00018793 [Cyprinus carpio]|nr:hypothetical protein cypCar_00018793 [Cyprinus carpio]
MCGAACIAYRRLSALTGEKDWQKYETARRLKKSVARIRAQYREDWRSKEMRIRQRALALRAGNEKDEGETADTVGCCSLRVEHIRLHPQMDGQDYVVFKNLQLFLENKQGKDDLFDRLSIDKKKKQLSAAKKELKAAKAEAKMHRDERSKKGVETKKKAVQRISEELMKLEVQATDREENKQIALGTSKLNYLDPRISVTWCKKWGVPIEKIYNKTQREKFAWAIDMTDEDFEF